MTVSAHKPFIANMTMFTKYLLLTEFEGRILNYGSRFFPSIYGPSVTRAGHKSTGKTRVRNLLYGAGNKVGKIFITFLYLEIERAKTQF